MDKDDVEDTLKVTGSDWKLNIDNRSNRTTFETKPRHQQTLHVVQNKETLTSRPLIPASVYELLAYYRSYTSAMSKLELVVMRQNDVVSFVWSYMANTLCKNLPMTYVYLFLSTYAPAYHFFLSKMLPITYGSTLVFIGTSLIELYVMSRTTYIYLKYVLDGVLHRIPWNRCPNNNSLNTLADQCYVVDKFAEIFLSTNITFTDPLYYTPSNQSFQLPQVIFFMNTHNAKGQTSFFIIMLIWILAALHYNQLFKSYIWKVVLRTETILNILLLIIFIHLITNYQKSDVPMVQDPGRRPYMLMEVDVEFLAESLIAPPVVHFLSSRSTREVEPNQDSVVLIISNAVYYLFIGFVSYLMKNYCENETKGPLSQTTISSISLYYFWTIYFSRFYWGDICVLMFFILNFIHSFYVFVITLHCLVEALTSDWCIARWLSILLILICGIVLDYILPSLKTLLTFIAWSATSTLLEGIVILWMYPVGRLIDDIYFHYGIPPSKLRKLILNVVPFYYLVKILIIFIDLLNTLNDAAMARDIKIFSRMMLYISVILTVGAVYSIFHVIWTKKGFWQLFKPIPEWGPADYHTRQLRKQFDSREYIESQASRELSRYLIQKSESKGYKIDITSR